jgi:hypothetical protein
MIVKLMGAKVFAPLFQKAAAFLSRCAIRLRHISN